MKLHPRHFNKFMLVVAIVAAVLIAITTLNYISGREAKFEQQMMEADSLGLVSFPDFVTGDSLRLRNFRGRYIVLDFWSTWSDPSLKSHQKLAEVSSSLAGSLAVVAASVRMDSAEVTNYRSQHEYPFNYVDGTRFYERMNLPGLPSQIFIGPEGEVLATFVGYTDPSRYDSLQTLIRNE